MLMMDPREARVLAAEHVRSLREEVAADRLGAQSWVRGFIAALLRRAAHRLDPAAPIVPSAA
jgi:hypothetical protein